MRGYTRPLALTLLLLLLCGCSAQPDPLVSLPDAQVTVADLFHEDGVYLFLPHDSENEEFLTTFGRTREGLNHAMELRYDQNKPANPEMVFAFEGVPAMVHYDADGFTIAAESIDRAALQAAMTAVVEALAQQLDTDVTFEPRGWAIKQERGIDYHHVTGHFTAADKARHQLAENLLEDAPARTQIDMCCWAAEWNGMTFYLTGAQQKGEDALLFQTLSVAVTPEE